MRDPKRSAPPKHLGGFRKRLHREGESPVFSPRSMVSRIRTRSWLDGGCYRHRSARLRRAEGQRQSKCRSGLNAFRDTDPEGYHEGTVLIYFFHRPSQRRGGTRPDLPEANRFLGGGPVDEAGVGGGEDDNAEGDAVPGEDGEVVGTDVAEQPADAKESRDEGGD